MDTSFFVVGEKKNLYRWDILEEKHGKKGRERKCFFMIAAMMTQSQENISGNTGF